MIGIYKITEIDNPNMFYIGKSNDIKRRFKEHQQKTYEQSRIPFDGYIKEKGIESFTYEKKNIGQISLMPQSQVINLMVV